VQKEGEGLTANIECRILNIEFRSAEVNPDVRRDRTGEAATDHRRRSRELGLPAVGPTGRRRVCFEIRTANRCMDGGL
jgi:hypothetical protein